jgi:uncharacterized protein YegL
MPGGGISRRPLHVIILADRSGSMKGEKIQQLNFAIREMVQDLASWEEEQGRAQVLVRAAIGSDARSDALTRFIANPDIPVLVASEPDQIADRIRLVTLTVTGARSFSNDLDEGGQVAVDLDIPV